MELVCPKHYVEYLKLHYPVLAHLKLQMFTRWLTDKGARKIAQDIRWINDDKITLWAWTNVDKYRALQLTELRKSSGAKEIALHVINVRENGKDVAIYLNDPRIARAMKIHYSPDNMGTVVRAMSQINRFLSNVNTSWNPSFVIPNFARDLETAGVNIKQYGEKCITKEVEYNTFKALRGIRDNLRTGEVDTEWAKEYLLFREYGGWKEPPRSYRARRRSQENG